MPGSVLIDRCFKLLDVLHIEVPLLSIEIRRYDFGEDNVRFICYELCFILKILLIPNAPSAQVFLDPLALLILPAEIVISLSVFPGIWKNRCSINGGVDYL